MISDTQFSQGIAYRFMLYFFPLAFIVCVLFTFSQLLHQQNREWVTLNTRLDRIETSNVQAIAQAVWNSDNLQLRKQMHALLSVGQTTFVHVRLSSKDYKAGVWPEDMQVIIRHYPLIYVPPSMSDAPVGLGRLRIVVGFPTLKQRLFNHIGVLLINEGMKLMSLGAIITFLLYWMVTRHLNHMARYAQMINLHRLNIALVLKRPWFLQSKFDALDQIVTGINVMRENIKKYLTERQLVEDSLAAQWEFLDKVISNIPSAIFWKDRRLTYIGCNVNFAEDMGVSDPAKVVGLTDYALSWSNKQAHQLRMFDEQILTQGRSIINVEQEQCNAAGKKTTVLMSKVPLQNKEGETIGILGVYADITDVKKAERRIHDLNDTLEKKVKERTQQLEHSNVELRKTLSQLNKTQDQVVESEKMAALGGLVAGIANEINTPIGIGVTAASYLQDHARRISRSLDNKSMTKTDFESFVKNCIESADLILKNLERAAQQIRGFKQIAIDQSSETKRLFCVKDYINEILISLNPKLKRTKHTVSVNCNESIQLYSVAGAFSKIITILIMNSVQHAFANNDCGHICIDVQSNEKVLTIDYRDDGKGIASEHLNRIFDAFYTTQHNTGGTGLGLHILYNCVTQALGGTVICSSQSGQGVHFNMTIPHEALSDAQHTA